MTDKVKVTEILQILKSENPPRKIYNTLLRVHNDVITHDTLSKEFKEKEGLNFIIQFLTRPNEKILNISLGILATCCADEDSCNKIVSQGILKHLIGILRCINEDRIHYRCYKLISILVGRSNFCSAIIENNILDSMITVLDGNPSLYTELMAIKTVRCVWIHSTVNDRKVIARSNIIRSVVKHFSSDNIEVQKAVLKVIFCVAKSRSDVIMRQAMLGDNLKTMILQTLQFPELILRIIYYLSEIKYFHFELAKAGALETMFEQIRGLNFKKLDTEKETYSEMVLRAAQRLTNEPKCREKLCNIPDAFPILLSIIENSPSVKFKKYAVLILTSFIYDEYSLRRLVRQRLIIVLVSYLQIIINSEGTPHDKNGSKIINNNLSSSPASSGRVSPSSDCETWTTMSVSPISERSGYSPTLSVDSVYSPVYSPVVDDLDDDDPEEEYEKLSIDDASSKADSPFLPQDDDIKPGTEEKIFNLLKQLTYISEPLYDLCVQRTWETFLEYLVLVRKTTVQVGALLSAIAGNPFFFNHLLKSEFALTVHKKLCRPVHADCPVCREMDTLGAQILTRYQSVAESSYGHQIIRNELQQNNCQKSRMSLVLTIPHVVKNNTQLEEYFLRYKILDFFIDSLNKKEENLLEEKVACLYSLATSLYVENPRIPCHLCKKCDVGSLVKEATISFLLDDGSTVTANKRTLCEKSEFFEAMFRCGFKEAKQSTVRLSNITSDCLTVLFRLLYSYCDCMVPNNVVVLLELIVQSDRFLIPALSEKLLNITMNSKLNHKNCHLIYNWAIEHGSFLPSSNDWPICTNVVKYALAEELSFNQRVTSFKMLLSSQHKSSVLKDIAQVIEHRLKCKDNKAKSSTKCFSEVASKKSKFT